jgi:hypothetical protein
MKSDMQKIYDRCITYRQDKYKVLSHSLCTHLLISTEP